MSDEAPMPPQDPEPAKPNPSDPGPSLSVTDASESGEASPGTALATLSANSDLAFGGYGWQLPTRLITLALLTGLCRFIPVPFVDDWIEQRILRFAFSVLLTNHKRRYGAHDVAPLYQSMDGCLSGCVGFFLNLPIAILLKTLKKLVRELTVVLMLRDVARTTGRTLLLTQTVHRLLGLGSLQTVDETPASLQRLHAEAALIRTVFDATFRHSDLRLLSNLISNAFASVQGMGRKSARAVRKMFEKADAPPEAAPASVEPTMREGTAALEDVASDPQVVSFVEDFRRRFEAALARAQNPAAPPPEGGEGPPPVAPTASPNP